MMLTEQLTKIITQINDLDNSISELYQYLEEHIQEDPTILGFYIDVEDQVLLINQEVKFDEELTQTLKNIQLSKYKINDTYYIPLHTLLTQLQNRG